MSRSKIINVMVVVGGLIFINIRVVFLIRCINKCFVVMLVVSWIVNVIGWINRLIVLIIISIGISEIGVFCGRKWVSEFFSLCWKFVIMVLVYSGMVIFRFMDSWVVGVNVCGKRFRRFVDLINMIREIIIRVYVCFFGVWISIICLIISLIS